MEQMRWFLKKRWDFNKQETLSCLHMMVSLRMSIMAPCRVQGQKQGHQQGSYSNYPGRIWQECGSVGWRKREKWLDSGYIWKVGRAVGFVDGLKVRCETKGRVKMWGSTNWKNRVAIVELGRGEFASGCVQCGMPIGHLRGEGGCPSKPGAQSTSSGWRIKTWSH